MAYGKDRWRVLGAAALGVLLGCFESSVAPTTTGDSSSGSPGGACIPGETQTCLCLGGDQGVQVCNPEGTGYEECGCVGGTGPGTSTGTSDTTGPAGTSTTGVDSGDSVGPVDSTDTGVADTGPVGRGYGPCNDEGCPVGEQCIGDPAGGGGVVCAAVCGGSDDCPSPPPGYQGDPICEDVQGNGEQLCFLPCADNAECPEGMQCLLQLFCGWQG